MTERNTDSVQVKDAAHAAAPMNEHDALINRVASEMASNKANSNLLSFQKAPENAAVRVGQAGLTALGHVPEGLLNAVVDNVKNPMQAVGTIGMGAAFAVGLKTVLPEAGPAGKLAAAAIGGYFTYKAAEPILDGFSKAKNATTMADMHNASSQIGDAVGSFAINSALAAGGYKLGAMAIEPVLASP
ncbi:MAG: hypothetical protein K2X81_06275, partial [Candidatus Obscuribacterales bacterium]|nr:hypothetical protein [Candidatus Obscuribacterales bacterium]